MKCEICSQASGCCRYGARVCNSCGSFFRRQILNPRPLYCRYLNNCGKYDIIKCKSCRLKRCFQVGMRSDRVNFFSPKPPEDFDSTPVEHIIYAQVLETLIEVCREDFEGTMKYLKEGNPKVQDVAACRFNQNHQLKDLSKRTKTWADILFKHSILQEELPLLFQLLVFHFALVFYKLEDSSIKFNFSSTNMLTSRFKQLDNMCQRLVNET
ncbi:hypothetical protein FO519_007453 [Halicephalobus sp. NKZ332]|nr:hypothetical protein FO519_007453 [Halicephalobus sp. NKZ332]